MRIKTISAAVGVTAILALPLAACNSAPHTPTVITVTSSTPMHPALQKIEDDADRRWSEAHPGQDVRVHRALEAQAKSHPAQTKQGIPWWVWALGTVAAIGGLLWWGTTLDDGSSARAARRYDDDDDDDWDDDDEPEPLLTYPAIPTSHAPEAVPYPEPTPSAPGAPAPSGSLMDRLGK